MLSRVCDLLGVELEQLDVQELGAAAAVVRDYDPDTDPYFWEQ